MAAAVSRRQGRGGLVAVVDRRDLRDAFAAGPQRQDQAEGVGAPAVHHEGLVLVASGQDLKVLPQGGQVRFREGGSASLQRQLQGPVRRRPRDPGR